MPRPLSSWGVVAVGLVFIAGLAGCVPNPANTPAPNQPKLVSASLIGHRVCGSLSVVEGILSFVCDPLPTNEDTGWQLTPVFRTNALGRQVANTAVILTISTPSLTQLDVQYQNQVGGHIEQTQIVSTHGKPKYVGSQGQVLVASTDDGNMKTWTLKFEFNTCDDLAQINIFNVSGVARSNPLHVVFLRDPSDTTTTCLGGVAPLPVYACSWDPRTQPNYVCPPPPSYH